MRSCFAGGIRGLTLIRGSEVTGMVDYVFVETCLKLVMGYPIDAVDMMGGLIPSSAWL